MKIAAAIRILASGLNFPEGPAFDSKGNLWCVEILSLEDIGPGLPLFIPKCL